MKLRYLRRRIAAFARRVQTVDELDLIRRFFGENTGERMLRHACAWTRRLRSNRK